MTNVSELVEQDELYVHKTYVVDKGQLPLRIDKFLQNKIEQISRNKIQNGIDAGNVRVNDQLIKSNYKVRPADVITLVYTEQPVNYFLIPEDLPIVFEYEDEDLAIVNKPPGLVVHPGVGNYTGTLVNGLLYHFLKQKNGGVFQLEQAYGEDQQKMIGSVRPYLVHRIDKNTSGLLLVAKNDRAMEFLANQFFHHTISRKYLAVIWGEPKEDTGTIVGSIARNPKDRQKFCVTENPEEGKHAVTHYRVLERLGYVSVVECVLETGRTHQIRVHMSHIGHPLFADDTYGGDRIVKGTIYTKYKQFIENCFKICNRQALHAKSLGFVHPTTKQPILFESEIPEDIQLLIEKWRIYMSALR
jgi:23S rRNA pseudouridine1911/1915/1917 synthase